MLALSTTDQITLLTGAIAILPAVWVLWFGLRGGPFFTQCGWRSWGQWLKTDELAGLLETVYRRWGATGVRVLIIAIGAGAFGGIIFLTGYNLEHY
jgi:hypothetical protein